MPGAPRFAVDRRRAALALLATGLVFPAVALEGRPPVAGLLTLALAGGAAWAAIRWARSDLVLAIGAAGWIWSAIQLAPVPVSWVSPRVEGLLQWGIEGLPAPSIWPAMHWSPLLGGMELLKGLAILATFVAAAAMTRAWGRAAVANTVILAAGVAAAVTLAHSVLGLERVYGFITPEHVRSRLPGPFLNENHLAGLLALAVPLGLSQVLRAEAPRARALWGSLTSLLVFVTLATSSRSGLAGLVVGVLGFVGLRLMTRDDQRLKPLVAAALVGVSSCAGVLLWLLAEPHAEEWDMGNAEKLELIRRTADLVAQSPWTGVGRGAFSVAFVGEHGSLRRFTHPENWPLQLCAEWGIPVTLAIVVGLGRVVVRAASSARSRTQMAAFASLGSVAMHDLGDYSTEVPAVALACATVLAVAITGTERREKAVSEQRRRRWPVAVLVAICAISVPLGAVLVVGRDPESLEQQIRRLLEEHRNAEALDLSMDAISLHRLEPRFPLLGATAASALHDPRDLALLNRAMTLAPGWHGPHAAAARALFRVGLVDQAWLEIREAERRAPGASIDLACTLLNESADATPAIRALARAEGGDRVLDRVASCARDPEVGATIDEALVDSPLAGPRIRAASRLVQAGRAREALSVLDVIRDRSDPRLAFVAGRAHAALGERQEAARLFERAREQGRAQPSLLVEIARQQAAIEDTDGVQRTIQALIALAGGSGQRLAQAYVLLGELEEQLGNQARAMQAFERAQSIQPGPGPLSKIGGLAERTGDVGRAYRAYRDWCRLAPSSVGCDEAQRLRRGTRP